MSPQELYDAAAEALSCLEGNHPDGAFVDAGEVAADILRAALVRWTRTHSAPAPKPQQRALPL
jgi:hypothetical protein